ncbi:hypothetical protein KIPB_010004 [Kipferlia bialata]|uniref:Uncharacterized protein n=1 Tax=Kipferlia bialata TaxID=797122 RepID=A0A391NYJ4_9EUKA|nr:hypothetical protein KIPB_010004 [Kipferlia bialata]|eukprot:g10004.t1
MVIWDTYEGLSNDRPHRPTHPETMPAGSDDQTDTPELVAFRQALPEHVLVVGAGVPLAFTKEAQSWPALLKSANEFLFSGIPEEERAHVAAGATKISAI